MPGRVLIVVVCMACWLLPSIGGANTTVIGGATRVIDADTPEVIGERVRLKGIDAPEKGPLCGNAAAAHHTNTIAQGTYICASAVIFEAYLSFLGAGTPPNIPSWGNIMAEGRTYVQIAFWIILFPGLFLALTVLAINLRDTLDPKLARRV